MSKIALIPIDNRPVCYQLPELILNQAKEHKLFLPNRNLLGDLTQKSDVENIISWIEKLKDIDIFIISLDTIAYGGLIQSRKCNDDFKIVINRINKLFDILNKKKAKIYAFSSIMRISNNNINEEEKDYWSIWGKKIFEYSYNFHKLGKMKTDVPSEILDDYINTRNRNFEINKYYIEMKKKGLINTLVFSKDDCCEFGLNVIEAEHLKNLSKDINEIFIKTGADEIPLTLLSRAVNKKKELKIFPIYLNPKSIDKISNYEDISVKKSVESQIELSGGIVSNNDACDLILIVNNFKTDQGELVMGKQVKLFNSELKLPNKPYLIADIVNANGSDNNFIKQLFSQKLDCFFGYAGWNTTGNTLGSVLSSALTYYSAEKRDKKSFDKLQIIRFLDDWAYQANIRGKICNNKTNLTSNILNKKMKKYEKIVFSIFNISEKRLNYSFPWNRFFEIEINFD